MIGVPIFGFIFYKMPFRKKKKKNGNRNIFNTIVILNDSLKSERIDRYL